MRLPVTLTAALLALTLSACGLADDPAVGGDPEDDPPVGETPADPGDEPVPDEIDPPEEATMLVGTFGGDAQLEGGCAWVDAEDERYEVLWPDGYQVEFDPLRLLGPDGEVVAEEGDTVRVEGRIARDVATICQVGQPFQADEVHQG